ncbi:MAG: SDR family oxidoreductase [Saccharothrix sp.]|nr:SDR family oxidoreductase [Saccharothrix sp.]
MERSVTGEFDGLVALVTGGASGIGRSAAELLAARGARVAVLDLVAEEDLSGDLFFVRADVADDRSVHEAVAAVVEHFGGLDVVVNNAGVGAQGDVTATTDEEWLAVFDVNVFGMARVARACLPHLRNSRAASIVNTGSIAGTAGLPQRAVYSASKGAVHALTRALAADHLREGVRVNAVAPGTADTPWVRRLLDSASDPAAERAALAARQPHGRLVTADEIAAAIAYLAGPLSGSTTGTVLAVDGGMDALRLRPRG